jgi:hypothetical protein
MTIPPESKPNRGIRTPLIPGLLLTGIKLMIGGELLCFFGAEAHARSRDIVCHIIFYCMDRR